MEVLVILMEAGHWLVGDLKGWRWEEQEREEEDRVRDRQVLLIRR